jgi:methionine-rich copper-binding protein CopC
MRAILFVAAAVLALVIAGDAQAHAFLLKSDPAVGATLAAPKTLRLEFSEGVEIALSGAEVARASGGAIATEKPRYDGSNRKVLLTDLPMLSPGAYRVTWHVVSVDTHRTEGDFTFSVK